MDLAHKLIINERTKIAELIKNNALVIETLVKLNPHFNKLKNPVLQKLLAGRVTIKDACNIGNCNLQEFFRKMVEIGFEIEKHEISVNTNLPNKLESQFVLTDDVEVIEFDVRPILSQKQDPLKLIIQKVDQLKSGQCLKLINSFEPVPLIKLLTDKGFNHHIERPDSEIVITYFIKTDMTQPVLKEIHKSMVSNNTDHEFEIMVQSFKPDKIKIIDVTEMEMPLPMVTILDNLTKLNNDEALFVYHKKLPVFLLPELKIRGFMFLINNVSDNKVNMLIYK
jgi:hypothetical protein